MNQPLMARPHNLGHALHQLERRWPWILIVGLLAMALGLAALVLTVSATIASVLLIGVFMAIAGGMEVILGANSKTWSRFFLWIAAGLLYIVAGAIAIAQPLFAATIFTLLLGAGLVATGAVRLWVASHMPPGRRSLPVFASLVTLALGCLIVIGWPGNSFVILGLLLGIDLIFTGSNWAAFAMFLRRHAHTRPVSRA